MKIEQKTSPLSSIPWYESESGLCFRRIAGGICWPFGDQAGMCLVVGEDLEEDQDFKVRHLRVLAERQEWLGMSFVEPGPMLEYMAWCGRELRANPWYGEIGPWQRNIAAFNGEQSKLRQPTIRMYPPTGAIDFAFHASLLRKRTMHEKTLHLGQGVLGAKLGLLPNDLSGEKHERHPAVAALFYAIAGLDMTSRTAGGLPERKSHGMADRAGGY
jgi:hypothetical protein